MIALRLTRADHGASRPQETFNQVTPLGEPAMIIFGSYVREKVIKTGDFYCPNCQDYRIYKLVEPRKWGHLYWLPLIPMEEFDIYAKCNSCTRQYRPAVLEYDPIRARQEATTGVIALVSQVMTMIADARGEQLPIG